MPAIEALVFCWGFLRLMCRDDAGQIHIDAGCGGDRELVGAARQIDRGIAVSGERGQACHVGRAISRQSLQRDAAPPMCRHAPSRHTDRRAA